MKRILVISSVLFSGYSCIKPHACECTHVYTSPQQKSHILVYSANNNKNEACKANNKDSSIVCVIKE